MAERIFLSPAEYGRWFDFEEYLAFMEKLVAEGKTSGEDQSTSLIDITRVNLHRIHRVSRHCMVDEKTVLRMRHIHADMIWIVIAEAWCGDVPQSLPYIHAIGKLNSHVDLRIILKNENIPVMNRFLTNGSQSIPKLVCVDPDTDEVAGTWGPRPAEVQSFARDFKKRPDFSKDKMFEEIQKWYAKDKGKQIQAEFRKLVLEWNLKILNVPQEQFG